VKLTVLFIAWGKIGAAADNHDDGRLIAIARRREVTDFMGMGHNMFLSWWFVFQIQIE